MLVVSGLVVRIQVVRVLVLVTLQTYQTQRLICCSTSYALQGCVIPPTCVLVGLMFVCQFSVQSFLLLQSAWEFIQKFHNHYLISSPNLCVFEIQIGADSNLF